MYKNSILFLLALLFNFSIAAQETVAGQILLQPTKGNTIADVLTWCQSEMPAIEAVYGKILSKHVDLHQVNISTNAEASLVKIAFESNPFVANWQYNHIVKLRETIPEDEFFAQQWHWQNDTDIDVDATEAWDLTTGGTTAGGHEIVVCVIEGADLQHEDLDGNRWENTAEIADNGIDDDNNGYVDDVNGWNPENDSDEGVFNGTHGTQVAGMVGAEGNNNLGVSGINWDIKIMSVALNNVSNEAGVIAAYDYPLTMRKMFNESDGAEGALVVSTNASWGVDGASPAEYPLWDAMYDTLGVYGVLNCAATSNNSSINVDAEGDIPTGLASEYMIAVTSTNSVDQRGGAYGFASIDLAAPGQGVFTTTSNNSYAVKSGTSFATPLVSGAVALLYAVPCAGFSELMMDDPNQAALLVREAIFDGVDAVDALALETVTGGRINVFNSLNILLEQCQQDCAAPFGFEMEASDQTIHIVSWNSLDPEIETHQVRWRTIGAEEWTDAVVTGGATNISIADLPWCAAYEFQARGVCGDVPVEFSQSFQFITGGCCQAPSLSATTADNSVFETVTLSWEDIWPADTYTLKFFDEAGIEEVEIIVDEPTYTGAFANACASYTMQIRANCAENDFGEPFQFLTQGCSGCVLNEFCTSSSGAGLEWIEKVEIDDWSNTSGSDSGYGEFGAQNFALQTEITHNFTGTPGYQASAFPEMWALWIDLNQDGEFADDEQLFATVGAVPNATSGTFVVPPSALLGETRMRISMRYPDNLTIAPCGISGSGETEDYCITITDVESVEEFAAAQLRVYPNPAGDFFRVKLDQNLGAVSLEILDSTGRVVASARDYRSGDKIDTENWSSGLYLVRVRGAAGGLEVKRLIVE